MSPAPPILEAQGITLGYGSSAPVLTDFELALKAGEIVTILGPSGVGKSSLIRVLAGLQRPNTGRVAIAGTPIVDVHPRVAIAFQNPGLLPWLALDEVTRAEMQRLLLRVVNDFRTAPVLVTHDIDEALLLSDRIVLIGGAPAREIAQWHIDFPQPRDDRVAELGQIRIDIVQALHKAVVRHH